MYIYSSKHIREKDIVNEVFKIGIRLMNREEANKLINNIKVIDTEGTFEIQYKF